MRDPLVLVACLCLGLGCAAGPAPQPEAAEPATQRPAAPPPPPRTATAPPRPAAAADANALRRDTPEATLEAMARDIRRQDDERAALAAHYLSTGQRAFDAQDYRAAVDQLEKAVALDMASDDAIALLRRAHLLAGDAPAYAETLDTLAEERRASVDMRRQRVAGWFDEGERLLELGRYGQAAERFERVLEALRWSEVPLAEDTLRARAQAQLVRAQVQGRDAELRQREQQAAAAAEAAERERRR